MRRRLINSNFQKKQDFAYYFQSLSIYSQVGIYSKSRLKIFQITKVKHYSALGNLQKEFHYCLQDLCAMFQHSDGYKQ